MGRMTAESFINIKRKDKILNPKKNTKNKQIIINFLKRNKYQNIEGDTKEEEVKEPNEKNVDDSEIEDIEEESDIFQIDNEEIEKKKREKLKKMKEKKRKDSFSCYHRTNEDAYKFHDLHMNKKRKKQLFQHLIVQNIFLIKIMFCIECLHAQSGKQWEVENLYLLIYMMVVI
jgi:hypothetical protein